MYGIDLSDRELLTRRTWRWLSVRIIGLLQRESRLQRRLNPVKQPDKTKPRGRRG